MLASALEDGQMIIRKKLLYSALNFLNNPRLGLTSTDQKSAFLLKKGLTQDEIDLVFQLAISRPSTDATVSNELDLLTASLYASQSPFQTKSTLSGKLLNLIFTLTVYGAFAYGSYTLYQTYVRPYFSEPVPRKEPQKEELRQEVQELGERINKLADSVSTVHEFVRSYCRVRDDSMLLLKAELASVKSLLVSRNNFPSVPSIPKWQLDNLPKKSSVPSTANTTNGHYSVNSGSDTGEDTKSD